MTVMALAIAHAREGECDTLEGHAMYDSSGEVVGWLGQVMDESGHPCEHMGMGDEGYTSCWSSSEISRLREENAKLRELCGDLFDRLMDKDEHCGECRSQCEHDAWNFGDPKCVYAKRLKEVGIEVDDAPDESMSDAARRVFDRLMSELGGDSDER